MDNVLYVADCRKVIGSQVKHADYVFGVPPDFAGLGLHPIKDQAQYYGFLREVLEGLVGITGCITISVTDRKNSGVVVPKHAFYIDFFSQAGWYFKSQKLWIKSQSINLFRLNYSHLLTFSKSTTLPPGQAKEFKYDSFHDPEEHFGGFKEGLMPVRIAEVYIRRHTQPGQVVYDPFTGTGTTAVAALVNSRAFVGSEISQEYIPMVEQRFKLMRANIRVPMAAKQAPFNIVHL